MTIYVLFWGVGGGDVLGYGIHFQDMESKLFKTHQPQT